MSQPPIERERVIAQAERRASIIELVEEQAALRRVATLVARGAPPEELFAAVTREVGQLLPVEVAQLGRYEPDRTVTFVATWSRDGNQLPIPSGLALGGQNLVTVVADTSRPGRFDNYPNASGEIGRAGHATGIRSAAGTPIIVDGRLWGLMGVGSTLDAPLPADIETRLADFTDLVATAIANAEGRSALARLAEEQAALRHIATLVARGVPPEQVFAAVVEKIGQMLPVDLAGMGHYESDGTVTFVAGWSKGTDSFPVVGSRFALGGENVPTIVSRTARPARTDVIADDPSPIGVASCAAGFRTAVGTPILVEGRLWGMIEAGRTVEQLLPPDVETRLADFTELVATAIANAESHAALTASRTRIVAAADETRRRIERDLHDGAQQRLVHAVILLKLALRAMSGGAEDSADLVAEGLEHAEQAHHELRELAHGILPSVLKRGGLKAAVEALVGRISLPVIVEVSSDRLPSGVEATAYFVISEALANVVKHSGADRAAVTASIERGSLNVCVRDDGAGGADAGRGSGIVGLKDRVAAAGGALTIESPPGGGTALQVEIPVDG